MGKTACETSPFVFQPFEFRDKRNVLQRGIFNSWSKFLCILWLHGSCLFAPQSKPIRMKPCRNMYRLNSRCRLEDRNITSRSNEPSHVVQSAYIDPPRWCWYSLQIIQAYSTQRWNQGKRKVGHVLAFNQPFLGSIWKLQSNLFRMRQGWSGRTAETTWGRLPDGDFFKPQNGPKNWIEIA